MERVLGIGGVFLRANDPDALGLWYETTLGVPRPPATYDDPDWQQEAGPTVWGFMGQSDAMSEIQPGAGVMITFRVRDLDAMVAQVRAAGTAVDVDPERYPNGRFASLVDPEGNPIQLWQIME